MKHLDADALDALLAGELAAAEAEAALAHLAACTLCASQLDPELLDRLLAAEAAPPAPPPPGLEPWRALPGPEVAAAAPSDADPDEVPAPAAAPSDGRTPEAPVAAAGERPRRRPGPGPEPRPPPRRPRLRWAVLSAAVASLAALLWLRSPEELREKGAAGPPRLEVAVVGEGPLPEGAVAPPGATLVFELDAAAGARVLFAVDAGGRRVALLPPEGARAPVEAAGPRAASWGGEVVGLRLDDLTRPVTVVAFLAPAPTDGAEARAAGTEAPGATLRVIP